MPKNGVIGNPGLGVELSGDGLGDIMIPPVSEGGGGEDKRAATSRGDLLPVCHHVSTTVQRPSPTTLLYHRHASSFRGSPTVRGNNYRGSPLWG